MTNHCGTCTACCRVFDIPALNKPAGKWCQHCAIGEGCKVYDDRPRMCSQFECLWLMSQKRPDPREHMKPEMRPDKCKVVFSPSTDPDIMAGTVMPGANDPMKHQGVRNTVNSLVRNGARVVVGFPLSTTRTMYDHNGSHIVHMTEPDADGIQWNIPDNKEQRP